MIINWLAQENDMINQDEYIIKRRYSWFFNDGWDENLGFDIGHNYFKTYFIILLLLNV